MQRKTDNELLMDISNKLDALINCTRLQNYILCYAHQKKLPKRLLRCAAPNLFHGDD